MSFEDWYERFYGTSNSLDKDVVRQILNAFGDAFDVESTRLLPSDRLKEELSIVHPLLLDDSWDCLTALLSHSFNRTLYWKKEWRTVDDAIRGLSEQVLPPREH